MAGSINALHTKRRRASVTPCRLCRRGKASRLENVAGLFIYKTNKITLALLCPILLQFMPKDLEILAALRCRNAKGMKVSKAHPLLILIKAQFQGVKERRNVNLHKILEVYLGYLNFLTTLLSYQSNLIL